MNDEISQGMGLEILEDEDNALTVIEENEIESQAAADIDEARDTYKELLVHGKSGLDTAKLIVDDSQHPRAIEVFANLISTLANVNGKLIDLHVAKKELVTAKEPAGDRGLRQNNMFIGSPKDLLDMMAKAKDE